MVREWRPTYNGGVPRRPRVGVVGGGQLARMLFEASIPLGVEMRVLARTVSDSAAAVACDVVVGDWLDLATIAEFADGCDVVTFDHELVPADLLLALESAGVPLCPGARAMGLASDKAVQRLLAAEVGLGVVSYECTHDDDSLRDAVGEIGYPAVVKATRGGYDGRAVWWLHSPADLDSIIDQRRSDGPPLLVERVLSIGAELATLVARRRAGETVAYPVVRTEQTGGICATVTAPAATTPDLARQAQEGAAALADALDYVGVLAVEYFVIDGLLHLNEMAPRPHNSGHYTIDACVTSQFENHLRAVLDWPLGDPSMITPAAVMANLIATTERPLRLSDVTPPAATRIHLYGKGAVPGRKVGHVTVCGADRVALRRTALDVAAQLTAPGLNPAVAP